MMHAILKGMYSAIWQQMGERNCLGQGRKFKKGFIEMSGLSWIMKEE